MKPFSIWLFGFWMCVFPLAAEADTAPPEVQAALKTPQMQGKTATRFWGLKLYDAELWTERSGQFDPDNRFALSIHYAHGFSAKVLARSSVEEIARVEGSTPQEFAKLEGLLRNCLIDVETGDRVTGVAEDHNRASMFINGQKRCTLTYPQLRKRFFGIWLAPSSRDAKGAARLRGTS